MSTGDQAGAASRQETAAPHCRIAADVEEAREHLLAQISLLVGRDLSIEEIRALGSPQALDSLRFAVNKVLHKVAGWYS